MDSMIKRVSFSDNIQIIQSYDITNNRNDNDNKLISIETHKSNLLKSEVKSNSNESIDSSYSNIFKETDNNNEEVSIESLSSTIKSLSCFFWLKVLILYIFVLFMNFYDFLPLYGIYYMYNANNVKYDSERQHYYVSGARFAHSMDISQSVNPFLTSINDKEYIQELYDLMDIIDPPLSTDHAFKYFQKKAKVKIPEMEEKLRIKISEPLHLTLTTSSMLKFSLNGTALTKTKNPVENIRNIQLAIHLEAYRLNVPNAHHIEVNVTGEHIEMSLDLGTYNLNEGSHEVRVSILMLQTSSIYCAMNVTATTTSIFYYQPLNHDNMNVSEDTCDASSSFECNVPYLHEIFSRVSKNVLELPISSDEMTISLEFPGKYLFSSFFHVQLKFREYFYDITTVIRNDYNEIILHQIFLNDTQLDILHLETRNIPETILFPLRLQGVILTQPKIEFVTLSIYSSFNTISEEIPIISDRKSIEILLKLDQLQMIHQYQLQIIRK